MLVNHLEGVGTIAVHVAVAHRGSTIGEEEANLTTDKMRQDEDDLS